MPGCPSPAGPDAEPLPLAVVVATCWVCGRQHSRQVRVAPSRALQWSCADCEVSWHSPGELLPV